MTDPKIVQGSNFSSLTFEKELNETSLDEYIIAAAEKRIDDVYMVSVRRGSLFNKT